MYNKKLLKTVTGNLDKAKAPVKKADIDYVSKMGYRDDSPFNKRKSITINTPDGSIDMSNTGQPLIANGKYLPPYSGIHQFDTNEVIETKLYQAKKGGSKKNSKSLLATNRLYKKNPLFKKPNYKSKTFDPSAMYFQEGGVSSLEGDLISKVIMNRNKGVDFVDRAYALGNNPGTPMFNLPDDEQFGQNMSHKMAWGEDDNGQSWMYPTIMNPNNEAIPIPNQYADYISNQGYKNATGMNQYEQGGEYIDAELTEEEIEELRKGGYIVQDISVPELTKAQKGLSATTPDSLDLYNNALQQKAYYDKLKPYYNKPEVWPWRNLPFSEIKRIEHEHKLYETPIPADNKKMQQKIKVIKQNTDPNIVNILDMIPGMLDPDAPLLKYNKNIKPQGEITYSPRSYRFEKSSPDMKVLKDIFLSHNKDYILNDNFFKTYQNYKNEKNSAKKQAYKKTLVSLVSKPSLKITNPEKAINEWIYRGVKDEEIEKKLRGWITTLPYYDPIAVKPAYLLNDAEIKQRVKKYGTTGLPKSRLEKLGLVKSNIDDKKKETKIETKTPAQQTVNNAPDPNRKVIGENSITQLDVNGKPVTTIEYVYEDQVPAKQSAVSPTKVVASMIQPKSVIPDKGTAYRTQTVMYPDGTYELRQVPYWKSGEHNAQTGSKHLNPPGVVNATDLTPEEVNLLKNKNKLNSKEEGGELTKAQDGKIYKDAYNKKYPPIILHDPNDPRIGWFTIKGNEYIYVPLVKKKILIETPKNQIVPGKIIRKPGDPKYTPYKKEGGALLTKKVTCKKCGWKWDAADGGSDITTCHKCGGQGLIHAQKGVQVNKKVIRNPALEAYMTRDMSQAYQIKDVPSDNTKVVNSLKKTAKIKPALADRNEQKALAQHLVNTGAASRYLGDDYDGSKTLNEAMLEKIQQNPNIMNSINKQEYQYLLDKEQKAYDNASPLEKTASFVHSAIADPMLVGSNLLEGKAPMMWQGVNMRDDRNSQTQAFYNQATGANDNTLNTVFNFVNPGDWGTQANIEADKGNYGTALGTLGLGIAGTAIGGPMFTGKGAAKVLNKVDDAISNTYKTGSNLTGLEGGRAASTIYPVETPPFINTTPPVQINKAPWKAEEISGLHLKSTMSEGPISKIVEPKTGLINTEQVLGIIAKESGGSEKVAMIKQALGETIPKKMDYNDFRKLVQDQLIPLEKQLVDHSSAYGLHRIGYGYGTINEAELLENQTILFSNKNKFGIGSSAHNNPGETLGHAHFFRDSESPDALTISQLQSDAFQGTHRMMPKTFNKEQELKNLTRLEAIAKRQEETAKTAKQISDNVFEFPDGLRIDKSTLENMGKSQKEFNAMKKAEIENFAQKQMLDKNHQERYIQEIVKYAAERGDINRIRIPTSETASKIQGYNKSYSHIPDADFANDILMQMERLQSEGKSSKEALGIILKTKNSKEVPTLEEIEEFNNIYNQKLSAQFLPEHKTILKKYSEQPKIIKKLYGVEPKIVTDGKGNTWYEFNIPYEFKHGPGEIKAFKKGGALDNSIELELSLEEIKDYLSRGYVIEEID